MPIKQYRRDVISSRAHSGLRSEFTPMHPSPQIYPIPYSNAKSAIDIQYASTQESLPIQKDIRKWVNVTLALTTDIRRISHENHLDNDGFNVELTVRIVDEEEGIALNGKYRGREMATNVLSFPCEASASLGLNLLGDIVICAPVVKREFDMQPGESCDAHWAHMVIHGTLHLLGYDHQSPMEARYMESMETAVLTQLGFPDPYRNPY